MPFVLLEGPFASMWSAQAFLFFLTYGFIGLELVSIKLSDPFGNGLDDVPISSIRDAAIIGIENDLNESATMEATLSERRLRFARQKKCDPRQQQRQTQFLPYGQQQADEVHGGSRDQDHGYHAMGGSDLHL